MELKNIKVGDRLTLVNRGICRSEYSDRTWIDADTKGRASFFEVSKVGRKYLYGFRMYVDNSYEVLKRQYWEDKINPEDVVIHEGFNEKLKEIYTNYTKALREHKELRKKAMWKIDVEIRNVKSDKINAWDKANPRPKTLKVEG